MFALSLNTSNFWVQFLASLGFLGGFAWAVVRWIHNLLAKSVSDRLAEWIHNLLAKSVSDRLAEEIGEIKKQTVPNGGGSLRDAIDRIEKKLDVLESEVIRHLGYHEGLEARQED